MRRAMLAAAVLIAALAIVQVALPGIAESSIEDRLTEGGGEAETSLSAFPALRLLFDDGDRFAVAASGLDLELDPEADVLDRLDGFGEVEVAIAGSAAGPLEIDRFELARRESEEPYRLVASGETSAAEIASFGAESLGLPGVRGLTGLAFGDEPIPFELEMELESDDGAVRVVSGGGSVAGLPAGPLAELVTAAIVTRL